MSKEIELKFQINHESISPFSHFFNTQQIIEQRSFQLTNTYFDTKEHDLRKRHSSVRIRGTEEQNQDPKYEITIKSAGNSVAGLHQRNEFNADLATNQLDLSSLPKEAFPENLDIHWLSSSLNPLFTTNFLRNIWLVHFNNSMIEVALDQGKITSQGSVLPIQEVELELKQGEQTDLLALALQLSQFNLHLFSQSKAGRGYRLLNQNPPKKRNTIEYPNELSSLLSYWQTNEEYALEFNELDDYQITISTVNSTLNQLINENDKQYPDELKKLFLAWQNELQHIKSVKQFAFSPVNTQLKLHLLIQMLSN